MRQDSKTAQEVLSCFVSFIRTVGSDGRFAPAGLADGTDRRFPYRRRRDQTGSARAPDALSRCAEISFTSGLSFFRQAASQSLAEPSGSPAFCALPDEKNPASDLQTLFPHSS
jgi:hypothetical protein